MPVSKRELTIAFIDDELNATDIERIVTEYKDHFKDIAFLDESDFNLDGLNEEKLSILNINMDKVNTYYKMGIIKQYLYPEKVDYFSKKAFEDTGHNKLNVKPMRELGLEFVYSSKRFLKPA